MLVALWFLMIVHRGPPDIYWVIFYHDYGKKIMTLGHTSAYDFFGAWKGINRATSRPGTSAQGQTPSHQTRKIAEPRGDTTSWNRRLAVVCCADWQSDIRYISRSIIRSGIAVKLHNIYYCACIVTLRMYLVLPVFLMWKYHSDNLKTARQSFVSAIMLHNIGIFVTALRYVFGIVSCCVVDYIFSWASAVMVALQPE